MKGAIGALFIDSETNDFENARGTLYSHNFLVGGTDTFGGNNPMPEAAIPEPNTYEAHAVQGSLVWQPISEARLARPQSRHVLAPA